MSEKQELAYILAKLVYGPNVSWDYHSSLTQHDLLGGAETILAAGFRKTRAVEREMDRTALALANEVLEFKGRGSDPSFKPIDHWYTRAYTLATAYILLLPQPEVEMGRSPICPRYSNEAISHGFGCKGYHGRNDSSYGCVADDCPLKTPQMDSAHHAELSGASHGGTGVGVTSLPSAEPATAMEKARELLEDIFQSIKHGDATHQDRLRGCLSAYLTRTTALLTTTAREALARAAKATCKWCYLDKPYDGDGFVCHQLGEGARAWCNATAIRALEPKP